MARIVPHIETLPEQPLSRHYRALFDWWTEHLGREFWIERSGSSIDYTAALLMSTAAA